jgi:two-component system OmpR family response regulator
MAKEGTPLTAISRRAPRKGCEAGTMPGERLLLVDDEENLRSMLEAALRHNGFEVSSVANGRDALDAVPTVEPDLIVLDVMLPDLDGFEVCRRLRAVGSRAPVLFLTARDATEDKVRGLTPSPITYGTTTSAVTAAWWRPTWPCTTRGEYSCSST